MNGPVEPPADMRIFAHNMRDIYEALVQEGFTDPQALTIIGQVVTAGIVAQGNA